MSVKNVKSLNIVMAWGGTGGHVFPIKSLVEYMDKQQHFKKKIGNIYRFGSRNSLESKVCYELESSISNVHFVPILSGKLRRETPRMAKIRNLRDFFIFMVGIVQSLIQLQRCRIDVIFCKGGYVALPVVIAGRLLRKKIIVHESDTHSGLVNKIAARFAKKTFTGFDNVLPRSETVGQILSDDIVVHKEHKMLEDSKLHEIQRQISPQKTIVLVVGGSQGSYKLYKSLLSILEKEPELMSNFVCILSLWVLNADLKNDFKHFPNVFVQEFFSQQEMGILCSIADIGLTRAGTTSLAEQKLYDMKLFIVPIAWTHDQYDNAKYYVSQYQDLLIDQKSSDFEKHLLQAFYEHVWFKKQQKQKDYLALVCQAKDKIATAIVAS